MSPILPPLQPNWTNLFAHVFIYTQKATSEGETHTHARIKDIVTRASTENSYQSHLFKLVITKGYGVRATTIEGQNAFAPALCFA